MRSRIPHATLPLVNDIYIKDLMLSALKWASARGHLQSHSVRSFAFSIMLMYLSLAFLWSLSFVSVKGTNRICYMEQKHLGLTFTLGRPVRSTTPTAWMQSSLSVIGNRPLRSICMPGSHDAGMSVIEGKTAFVTNEDVLTQTGNIGSQLSFGSRYFDLRPVIASGVFKTGHYSEIEIVGWQGADGQAFSEIISELNAFTASNAELIVLNLSHDLNTDSGYGTLTQSDWNNLFTQMLGINHLFIAPNPTSVDLTTMTVNQFIGGGNAAVLVIAQPSDSSITLGSFATQGFYTYGQYNAYNNYADTDDLDTMISDQLSKMRSIRTSPTSQLFLLSWTLTQDAGDIITDDSIIDLANKADAALDSNLSGAYTSTTYPNIIYIDNFSSSDATSLAMTINSSV